MDIEGGPNDGNSTDGPPGARDELRFDVENLRGGSGGDTLKGNAGANAIDGGPGDDSLDGGAGADSLGGGDGTDRVAYESRAGDVEVTMDGVPGDGEPGEGDNVGADVENVGTGSGADTVTGTRPPTTSRRPAARTTSTGRRGATRSPRATRATP